MSKSIIVLLFVLLIVSSIFAQTDSDMEEAPEFYMGGDKELSGFIHFKYQTGDLYQDTDGSSKIVVHDILEPGYFVIDKLSIGLMLMLEIWKTGVESEINAGYGPRIDYYIPYRLGPGYTYLHGGAVFMIKEQPPSAGDSNAEETRYEFGAGYSVPINEHISIAALLYYSINRWDPVGVHNASDGTSIGMRVGIKSFHF